MLPHILKDLPVVSILHGDDDYSIGQTVDKLVHLMGDPAMADLNIARLDGAQVGLDDIKNNLYTLPFLSERRMVILTHPFARGGENQRENFLGMLNGLPQSAALIVVVDDSFERKEWKIFSRNHWLAKWAQSAGANALSITCQLPAGDQMAGWILNYARSLKGQFDPPAAGELAGYIGNDTRLAALEIEKLLTYVDFKRPVAADDVILLTTATKGINIFDMVDAVAQQNSRKSIKLLHQLLEQQDSGSLFFMIVRQFRLLIQAREILDENGSNAQIEQELKLHPFVAKKLTEQARAFTQSRLVEIYHRLFEIDEAIKTSQVSMELALDTFLAGLA